MIANPSGGMAGMQYYEAWGETRYTSGTRPTTYQFTGQRHEQSVGGGVEGLYFYGARWLDVSLGRFLSADTIIPQSTQGVQAWDRYAYANNNPVRYTDPTGHRVDDGCETEGCNSNKGEIAYVTKKDYYRNCQSGAGGGCPDYSGAIAFTFTGLLVAGGGVSLVESVSSQLIQAGTTSSTLACADGDCTNEINTGKNVVYQLVENGVTKYVGITNNFLRRGGEHFDSRGWAIETFSGLENLSRFDARAVEQLLIEHYGIENLYNRINSISPANPIYHNAIQRATTILNSLNFFTRP